MIYLRRSGSALTTGSGDIGFLEYVARGALDRGETVKLHIDGQDWRPVTSPQEVSDVLEELYDELDARRDALAQSDQLPLLGDAS
ncbi:hypothetical protein G6031_09475 [Dietzia sp. CQ4]|uniref:hypothetical protein n=1 Tax=Dietzia sp. (strain CQ4) TaxID=370437 RepID=UPI0015FDFCA6|nr:hypothetical protein [Dietzia sp. CQ4]MBB1034617.1 hypothetical protein [Dietzia sp. CQ4]